MSIKVFDNQHANSNSSFWAMVSTSWHYQINLNTTYDIIIRKLYYELKNIKISLNILRPAWIKDDIEWLDNSFLYNEGDDNTTR